MFAKALLMHIRIAQRLRPYSHQAGEFCLIPGTLLAVQAFPALLVIYDIAASSPKEIARHAWQVQGPVRDFTVEQDLEKGCVRVWGHGQNGFFRYRAVKSGFSYAIVLEKAPEGFTEALPGGGDYPQAPLERLFLGVDKQQDWTGVKGRLCLAEILPFWLRLGSMTPATPPTNEGTASLLAPDALCSLFMTAFEGMMFPHLSDIHHQGFELPPVLTPTSAAYLLSEGARVIRSLFIQQEENKISLLPLLPTDFHSGRLIEAFCDQMGRVDMEWRSHKLRRVVVRCHFSGNFSFLFPKALKTFRFRQQDNVRGDLHFNGTMLSLQAGQTYFMDLFEA